MSFRTPYSDEFKQAAIQRILSGESQVKLALELGVGENTLCRWSREHRLQNAPKGNQKMPETRTSPKTLIYDIETLPNLGYFWDTISDRAIPLDFVLKPKSICTIAYKWLGEAETYVLVVDTPYDDKPILEQFLPEWSKADYVVAHYSRFDKPFIAARLMANGLPSLPPVCDICTYKLAKHHFGRSLNGNKLDHLGSILGVGNKIKTSADLWVGCASGDKESLQKMAEYNVQDVELLEKVFNAMLPYVKSKLNHNLHTDDAVLRCKQCGSDNLQHNGYEYLNSTLKHRYLCKDCGSHSTFPRRKT